MTSQAITAADRSRLYTTHTSGAYERDAETGEAVAYAKDLGRWLTHDQVVEALTARPGEEVEAGEGEDHDTGRIVEVDGVYVTVAWSGSETTTRQRLEALDFIG